jgi:MazG family protein
MDTISFNVKLEVPVDSQAGIAFSQLVDIMARLRAPDGCPWDREQTFESIAKYTIEETYEVVDAIERRDYAALREELGDLLLQPVFHAQMASERGLFNIADALQSINEKLIRRHPHVFGAAEAATADDVKEVWDRVKAEEKPAAAGKLDSVNRAQPALMETHEISKKAAKAGFEWERYEDVEAKLQEELTELREARAGGEAADIEAELGDLLFTAVNLARWNQVDPEQALRRANAKFRRRFAHVEKHVAADGLSMNELGGEELDRYWREAKQA